MSTLGLNTSSTTLLIIVGAALFLVMFAGTIFLRRKPSKLDVAYFQTRWQDAQKLCANQDSWPLAVINADKLLDEALKRRKYKGKTMGERLVAAQHDLTENDDVGLATSFATNSSTKTSKS